MEPLLFSPARKILAKNETYHADSVISRSELRRNLTANRIRTKRKFSKAYHNLFVLIDQAGKEKDCDT